LSNKKKRQENKSNSAYKRCQRELYYMPIIVVLAFFLTIYFVSHLVALNLYELQKVGDDKKCGETQGQVEFVVPDRIGKENINTNSEKGAIKSY